MKKLLTLLAASAALPLAGHAAITVVGTNDVAGTSPLYGTTYFSAVSVNVGDILVVSHANNKRDNGTNTITAAFNLGSNVFTAVGSGDTGGQAAAYTFYSTITEAGTFNITLDTNNATKSVSQATTYFVLRAGTGNQLNVADTSRVAAGASASQVLTFDYAGGFLDSISIAASATDTTATFSPTTPSGWISENNGASRRMIQSISDFGGTQLNATFSVTPNALMALSGIVITETAVAVPEPSSFAAIAGLGMLGFAATRRRRR